MTQPGAFSAALAAQHPQRWQCLPCIAEHKAALLNSESAPVIRDAVTLLNGAPHCYEHIQVQAQSPLALPTDLRPFGSP